MRPASLIVSALLFIGLPTTSALAEKRVALVIGNDRYLNLSSERQLQKAVNDAEAVGDTLAHLGFEVIRGRNLGRQAMIDKLAELTAKLEPGDIVTFFYAGHGVAIGGVNYLVPADVPPVTEAAEARVRGASISEPDLVAEIQARSPRVAFLALDACRDNPFPRSGGRSIGQTRGLADAKPARGVFTIYSAGIGQTALDRLEPNDPNLNSVFTRVFISELSKPGVDLSGLAIAVRERVAELALKAKDTFGQPDPREQTPAYYDQTLGGRIYLAGLPKLDERTTQVQMQVAPAVPLAPAADEITWSFLENTADAAALRRFVNEFPASDHRGEAETRLAALEREAKAKEPLDLSAPTIAHRAVLYEETGKNSHVVTMQGRVAWRVDSANVGQSQRLDAVVRVDVGIPEAGLTLNFVIRRNTDARLPASHTIEITFGKTAGGEGRTIKDIGVPQFKTDENASGVPLEGVPAPVADNFFLVGLSNLPADVRRNLDLLRNRNWIDIPIMYADGRRGVLAFEKGASGDQALKGAFEVWARSPQEKKATRR